MKAKLRNRSGVVIAEFGPALFVLFLGFLFPLLVLVALLCEYGSLVVLNAMQIHEATLIPYSDATDVNGPIIRTIPTQWKNDGLGRFTGVKDFPATTVTYKNGQTDANGLQDKIVHVSTTATISPFITIPFFWQVPGLSAPMTFTLIGDGLMENQDNAP